MYGKYQLKIGDLVRGMHNDVGILTEVYLEYGNAFLKLHVTGCRYTNRIATLRPVFLDDMTALLERHGGRLDAHTVAAYEHLAITWERPDWLKEVYALAEKGDATHATEVILDYLDDHFIEGEWDKLNKELKAIEWRRMTLPHGDRTLWRVLLNFLKPEASKLPCYPLLAERMAREAEFAKDPIAVQLRSYIPIERNTP